MTTDPAKLIDKRVAERIREQRKRIGLTQQALARMIGVAFQQAHKYEHGISRVSAGRLYQLATALKAPITYFFAPDEEAEKHAATSAGEGNRRHEDAS